MPDQQTLAIEKVKGPCLIFAGPGTGKTYTLVKKIKHLIDTKEYEPSEILALTFSVEATKNLREEVEKEVGAANQVTIRTFHGFCADVLRAEGPKIGIDPGFDILEPDDTKIFFLKYLDIKPYYADLYSMTISTAKDLSISLEEIEAYTLSQKEQLKQYCPNLGNLDKYVEQQNIELNTLHLKPQTTPAEKAQVKKEKALIVDFLDKYDFFKKYQDLVDAWKAYNELKRKRNLMDFSDLNLYALEYFKKYGSKKYSEQYKYILVDEFQDRKSVV
jgi:DNA helicase-2/ATP-dependent DNA helicase PcrA